MLLNQLMENNPNLITYKGLNSYIKDKYGRYEIKYEENYFISLLQSLLLKYKFVLKSIEESFEILNTNTLSLDKLGEISTQKQEITNTNSNSDSLDYKGLNTNGTFEEKKKSGESEGIIKSSGNRYNYYDTLTNIQNPKDLTIWFAFEREFVKLLKTIIALESI